MATYTLAAADALLKDVYPGHIVEQFTYKTWMLDQIQRDSDKLESGGRRAVVPVTANRNRGRGSRGDNANLPVAGVDVDLDAVFRTKYHYYAIEISDPAIEAATSEGAFTNLLERTTKNVPKYMKKDFNRMIYGDGTGLLTSVRAANTAGLIPVDSVQYVEVGDPVDIIVKADGSTTNGVLSATVTARDVTSGAQTITVSPAPAGAVGTTYGVYIAGNRNNEVDGLAAAIGKARTYGEINSATPGQEFWNSSIIDNGGNVAGESVFEQLEDDVTDNGEISAFVTTKGIRRRLADGYQSQKRYNDANAVKIHGGYTAIFVNEHPVIADKDAPKGKVWAIDNDTFRWYEIAPPDWMKQKDSSIFTLKNSATAGQKVNVWQAWFKWYTNLGNSSPNKNGAILNVEDDAAK